MKRALVFLLGTIFGLALVATCGTSPTGGGDMFVASVNDDLSAIPSLDARSPGDLVSGTVRDQGRVSQDLSSALADLLRFDIAVRDARADPPISADCNKTWSYTQNGATSRIYYAEFSVVNFDPTQPQHVTAFVCNPVLSGGGAIAALGNCPMGAACDAPLQNDTCGRPINITGGAGVIRVTCGSGISVNGNPETGSHYTKAYLKFGP